MELAKKIKDQEEDNMLLRESISQLEQALGEVQIKTKEVSDKLNWREEKDEEVLEEDKTLEPDPILQEEPLLKVLKSMSGKAL